MPNLVITRKPGETFWVGNTKITYVKAQGCKISIAITAPKETKILRGELKGRAA